jgi:hypothetical protein
MGIRFFCPNGHRLNVKSFLAGKRGVCPDCGIGLEIPMESDARALSSKKKAVQAGGISEDDKATAVLDQPEPDRPEADISIPANTPTPPAAPLHNDFALPASIGLPPAALPEPVLPSPVLPTPAVATPNYDLGTVRPAGTPVPRPVVPSGVPLPASAGPTPPTPVPSVPPAGNDPIAEAPNAIWYVRPTAGGQYGPARGDVMRKWLTEGRVTNDSLVWREGWPDWRGAAKIFPDLGKTGASSGEALPLVSEGTRRPIRPASRKATTAQGVGIVIALAVVCIGLFVALIYVLMNSTGGTPPTP